MSRLGVALGALIAFTSSASAAEHWVYLATSTDAGGGKGIYRCLLDDKTGKLTEPQLAAEMASPTFLVVHPSGKYLYALGAGDNKDGGPVVAYSLDPTSGALTKLNHHLSGGAGPTHAAVHPNGRYLIVANSGGGSTAVFRLDDGKIGARTDHVQHEGSSVVKGRQDRPHAYCTFFDHTGKKALTADLGLDKIKVFGFDADKGTLSDEAEKDVTSPPGSGPRDFALNRNDEYLYYCGELNSTVNVVRFAKDGGATIQSLSTLPSPSRGNAATECVLTPNGRFVYVCNCGHDSVAVFKVKDDGKLTEAGHLTGLKGLRSVRLDPSGRWLFVAGPDPASVGMWELDPTTGAGKPAAGGVKLSKCVALTFAAVEKTSVPPR